MTSSLSKLDGSFLADQKRSGLFLDFDGTLAPIASAPETVQLGCHARAILASLARSFRAVAVVSGRGIDDLAARVDVPGLWLSGSHGMVIRPPDGSEFSVPITRDDAERLASAEAAARPLPAAVRVEHKPGSVAFHYRGHEADTRLIAELAARTSEAAASLGLIAAPGRCVVEIRLPGFDKGAALHTIVEQTQIVRIAVVGDDWTDLDAFHAAHTHPTCTGLAIVVRSAETPPPLLAEADAVAEGVDDVIRWLAGLAGPGDLRLESRE